MLPHLAGRPVTVKRFPNGIGHKGFIEKNVPKHAPEWIQTMVLPRKGTGRWGKPVEGDSGRETTEFVLVDDMATMTWLANLASVEFHTPMWRTGPDNQPRSPDLVVFDLDPGPPATLTQCCQVALRLRDRAAVDTIDLLPKTSGSKGLQLYGRVTDQKWAAEQTNTYAHTLAEELEHDDPDLVVSRMAKALRTGRVLIDWSQNNTAKTTVTPYSLRAIDGPTVSTPLTWDEVAAAAGAGPAESDRLLAFTPQDVLDRVDSLGDLFTTLD
jgi:bifunctional non-homologous end joining protein LigD